MISPARCTAVAEAAIAPMRGGRPGCRRSGNRASRPGKIAQGHDRLAPDPHDARTGGRSSAWPTSAAFRGHLADRRCVHAALRRAPGPRSRRAFAALDQPQEQFSRRLALLRMLTHLDAARRQRREQHVQVLFLAEFDLERPSAPSVAGISRAVRRPASSGWGSSTNTSLCSLRSRSPCGRSR